MQRIWPARITTLHVDLGVTITEGIEALRATGGDVFEEFDREQKTFRVNLREYEMALYDTAGTVSSIWYNDPAGRLTSIGRQRKLKLYMARFTTSGTWDLRIQNGWMNFYFNDIDGVTLVHGLHKDVIRINSLRHDGAATAA